MESDNIQITTGWGFFEDVVMFAMICMIDKVHEAIFVKENFSDYFRRLVTIRRILRPYISCWEANCLNGERSLRLSIKWHR